MMRHFCRERIAFDLNLLSPKVGLEVPPTKQDFLLALSGQISINIIEQAEHLVSPMFDHPLVSEDLQKFRRKEYRVSVLKYQLAKLLSMEQRRSIEAHKHWLVKLLELTTMSTRPDPLCTLGARLLHL